MPKVNERATLTLEGKDGTLEKMDVPLDANDNEIKDKNGEPSESTGIRPSQADLVRRALATVRAQLSAMGMPLDGAEILISLPTTPDGKIVVKSKRKTFK